MFTQTDTDYNLDRHLISFLQDCPFFAELSRHIRKVPTTDIPTAGVTYDQKYDDITLLWNPEFFRPMSDAEVRGILTHEFYHLIFQHVSTRIKKPFRMWNVATDLAINSIITDHGTSNKNIALPAGGLIPGVFPKGPEGREYSAEEKAAMPIAELIASFPRDKASEWYFDRLKAKAEELTDGCPVHGGGEGDSAGESDGDQEGEGHKHGPSDKKCTCKGKGDPFAGIGSMDDHDGWEQIPEELREMVAGKVAAVVERATKHADSQANGWGSIPANLRDEIRRSVSNIVDWRNVLRQFVGQLARGERATTMKRINKRYPYIHPGQKRGYVAKLLIAIDQSGSVSNDMLGLFFAELASLTKKVSVTILPFDCVADIRDAYEWKKGSNVSAKRVRGGGTDFDAPTAVANDPKNRGRWDGMLIMTDGECNSPGPSRVKRGWIVGPGQKLYFSTNEMTITLDAEPKKTGAWR